ncbi:MAG: TIGR03619 family F420-dependent LLM class oxidoreductase [Thermodesulfobacteriota bacterium]
MSATIGFGIGLPVVQQVPAKVRAWEAGAGPAEIERVARAADRLGFAHVACSDHAVVPRSYAAAMGTTWYDAISTLAYVGGMTERIELLTHVLVLPYHQPVVLAKQLATLDAMTRGRLVVGVGSGHLKPEFRTLGIDFEQRGAITDESMDVLKALWTGEPAEFCGRWFSFRDVLVDPRPHRSPHPPIWVGGNARRTVRRAVERGDGWVPWQLGLDELAALIAYGRELLDRRGGGSWEVVAPFPTVDLLRRGGDREQDVLRLAPSDLAARIERYRALGVARLHVSFVSASCAELLEQLEAFASEVMVLL